MKITRELIQSVPKVLLHDHLDGGLRPETIIELAKQEGVDLPAEIPEELAEWFFRGANRGSLSLYLEGFNLTCGVMQTEEALERVAYEMMEDMKNDNIAYVETRFAPVFHMQKGLTPAQVVAAVLRGLNKGREDFGVEYGLLVCAMRNLDDSLDMAELAVDFRDRGVVGFDLAGEEHGYPPKRHIKAFQFIQRQNFNITLHAGEGFSKESIWQALQYCGAHRIGHATRVLEDITVSNGKVVGLGDLAHFILDKRIPLEICLSSNVHTGAIGSFAEHPFPYLYDKQFRVTINTDNRLMSHTTLTDEYLIAVKEYDLELDDIQRIVTNGMKSAFIHYDERCRIIYDVIKPGYKRVKKRMQVK